MILDGIFLGYVRCPRVTIVYPWVTLKDANHPIVHVGVSILGFEASKSSGHWFEEGTCARTCSSSVLVL